MDLLGGGGLHLALTDGVFVRGAILLINFFELERQLQKTKIETKWDSKIVVKLSSNTTG